MTEPKWMKASGCSGGSCVEVARARNGDVLVRDSKDPAARPLWFSPDEWDAFVAGVRAGEFRF